MSSSKLHIAGAVLGVLFIAYGFAAPAQARSGDTCYGWIHQVQSTSGVWMFYSLDCNTEPAACSPPPCELVPVPGSGNLKWRCGCGGVQDGTCDATEVLGGGGTRGECLGSCSPGACHVDGEIDWTDQNGVNHRLISCGC